jgi:hypothetical protein
VSAPSWYVTRASGAACACGQPAAVRLTSLVTDAELVECLRCVLLRAKGDLVLAYTVPKLAVACCVCRAVYGAVPCAPEQDGGTSHGICRSCWPKYLADAGLPREEYPA